MEPKQRKEATSIAGRAINWFTDKLGITKAPTYTDGYGNVKNAEVPFWEGAQGQELKRIGETAKTAGQIGLVGAGFINPFTASSLISTLLGTAGAAYGLSLGAQNVYNTSKQFVKDPSSVSNVQLISAGLDMIPFGLGVSKFVKGLPKLEIPESIRNIDWKSLRYELDPRYMRVYHATDEPFDIQHFYTGTVNDSGLHVSKKPLDRQGNVLYKAYIQKPNFRFFDTWFNGARMFDPEYKISVNTSYFDTPAIKELFKKANVKYKTQTNAYNEQYLVPLEDKTINLAELIFPKNKQLQLDLSDLARQQKPLFEWRGVLPGKEQKVIDINKQVSDILSRNNYKVGVYGNGNSYETLEDSYSIFDPDALKYAVRVKEKGGKINEDN